MPGCKKAFAIGASPWPYGGLRASLRLVVAGDPRRLARRPGRFISYNKESYFNQQGLDIQLPIEGFFQPTLFIFFAKEHRHDHHQCPDARRSFRLMAATG
jgi:hypothetical protein